VLWISSSLTPQEIRDRVLADTEFERALLLWLEDSHSGDFSTRSSADLALEYEEVYYERTPAGLKRRTRLNRSARDPATCLPKPPPPGLGGASSAPDWYASLLRDSDAIAFCSNRHDSEHGKGCWVGDPIDGYCKARFPRDLHEQTVVDRASGAIRFAKSEPWLNTFNPTLSYLLRCNSDVTCLLSGTQVKAVVAYVSDYITKHPLNMHTFFEIVKTI
ncbi:hypothetical protein C8Q78DRAFT_941036, partial [Trametes maxima]